MSDCHFEVAYLFNHNFFYFLDLWGDFSVVLLGEYLNDTHGCDAYFEVIIIGEVQHLIHKFRWDFALVVSL